MPPGQLVHEPPPASDPKPESTDEEDDREEEMRLGVCYFSEYGQSADEESPRGVYEVDSGSTTPTKSRPVPAPNVRACSKSSPRRTTSDLWYYRFLVKSADLSRFKPFSDFLGRSVPKHGAPNQTEGRLGRHPPVWGDANLGWVRKFCGRRGKGVDAPA